MSRFIRAAANGRISFLKCLGGVPFSVCIIIYVFIIYSSLDGQLGCSHVLAIVSFAAMNIGVHQSFQGNFFSRYMLRIGIVGSYGNSVFTYFEELPYRFPQWLHQFTLPQQCKRVSLFCIPSPACYLSTV